MKPVSFLFSPRAILPLAMALASVVSPATAQTFETVAMSRERFTRNTPKTDRSFFGSFGAPGLNDKRSVTFYTTIYGPKIQRTNNSAICLVKGQNKKVQIFRDGDAIDGNTVTRLTKTPEINRSRKVAWTANIEVEDDEGNVDTFIVVMLASPNGRSRFFQGSDNTEITGDDVHLNSRNRASLLGLKTTYDDDGNQEQFETVFRLSLSSTLALVGAGEVPIGLPLGTTYDSFGTPTIDDLNNLYYVADLSDDGSSFDGIWYGKTGDPAPLVVVGDEAPDGNLFESFQTPPNPSPNGKQVAFAGATDGTTGVWLVDTNSEAVTEVAVDSNAVDGLDLTDFEPAGVNNAGVVAFAAAADQIRSLYVGTPGNLTRLVYEGMEMNVDGTLKTVINFRFNPSNGINSAGEVAFTASFNDRSSGVFIGKP